MKVYIVLEYVDVSEGLGILQCRVDRVYTKRKTAEKRQKFLNTLWYGIATYHVIKKTLKGKKNDL